MTEDDVKGERREFIVSNGDVQIAGADLGGEGQTLVLLHGGRGNLRYFDPVAPHLAADGHVVAFDLRGHGQSSKGSSALDDHVADLLAVIAARELHQPVLIGASAGAFIALRAAAELGSAVAAVVSIDGPLVDPDEAAFVAVDPMAVAAAIRASLAGNPAWQPWTGGPGDLAAELAALEVADMGWMARSYVEVAPGCFERRPDLDSSVDLLAATKQPFEASFGRIACPVLAIVAEESSLLFGTPEARRAAAVHLGERYPRVDVRIVPGGHDQARTRPRELAADIWRWLRSSAPLP